MVFLPGEKIDLCVPEEKDFITWSKWFNSQKVTAYLDQGEMPNTEEMQKEFYETAVRSGRFVVLIKSKEKRLLGVISLSEINYKKRSCQVSLVCPIVCKSAPLAALEAMALVTEHAFKRLGMKRVWAGQAYPGLRKWNQTLEVLGYKAEGLLRSSFVHGIEVSSTVAISLVYDDFVMLSNKRNGHLWPGEKKARFIISKLRKLTPTADKLADTLSAIYSELDSSLDEIEAKYE